nr:uncharacterized protein LOC100982139 [Pan paniscus]
MPSTGLPHPFGSLPGHSVVLSSRVSPSPHWLSCIRVPSHRDPPWPLQVHADPAAPQGCHRFPPSQTQHTLPAWRCAAPSLWSRVWQSAHQFLLLPWDSPAFSTAIHSANWDCWSPYLAASDKIILTSLSSVLTSLDCILSFHLRSSWFWLASSDITPAEEREGTRCITAWSQGPRLICLHSTFQSLMFVLCILSRGFRSLSRKNREKYVYSSFMEVEFS